MKLFFCIVRVWFFDFRLRRVGGNCSVLQAARENSRKDAQNSDY